MDINVDKWKVRSLYSKLQGKAQRNTKCLRSNKLKFGIVIED
jgi:hypothetical protein